ncbi:MAG: DUF5666 domain-containing protein [Actinomycetota bacterium]
MKIRNFGLAALAAVAALVGSASITHAADPAKPGKAGRPTAAGKVSKIDVAAKSFVVSNKKKGDFTVSFTDATTFKKAPATEGGAKIDAKATDLKDGMRVAVKGKVDGTKVQATEVTIGGARKKKKAAN